MRFIVFTFAIGVCACSSDSSNPPADAAKTTDGAKPADAKMIDAAGSGSACTGALYDPCTGDNTQCTSNDCHTFNDIGGVCTQACSASNPCPTTNGITATCNNMGICKPTAPNDCTR